MLSCTKTKCKNERSEPSCLIGIESNAYPKGRLGILCVEMYGIGGKEGRKDGRKLLPITP